MSTTVTFRQNFPAGTPSQSVVYKEAGLNFSNSKANRWSSPLPHDFVEVYGYPSQVFAVLESGKTFDFFSCQFMNPNRGIESQPVTYIGTKANGQQVTQDFRTTDHSIDIFTFAPENFTDLVRLEMHLGSVSFANFAFNPHGAQTVTFKSGFPAGCPSAVASYSEAGLTFKNSRGNRWCSPAANDFIALYEAPGHILVTPNQGASFDLKTLQACTQSDTLPGQDLTFTGIKAGGGVVRQSFATPDHSTKPWTYALEGFDNLITLDIAVGQIGLSNLVFVPHRLSEEA